MVAKLESIQLRTPGNRGLVTDQAGAAQEPEWSLKLRNAVINSSLRIAARQGWELVTTAGGHSDDTNALHEFVVDSTTSHIVSAADTAIYSGTTTLVDRSDPSAGLTVATADDWQFVNLNGKCYGWQADHTPIVWDPSGVTYDADDFQDLAPGTGTAPDGNAALATHGRLFAFDGDMQTIKWCALLNDDDWSGAGSGSLDMSGVWPIGLDIGVALCEWGNLLVVFGERSVVLYSGLDDPTANLTRANTADSQDSLGMADMITGDGLVARDAVVSTGTDLIYLSRSGLRTLSRGLQFRTLPLTSIAPHLQLKLSADVENALDDGKPIRMTYHRPLSAIIARIGDAYWYFDVRDLSMVRASQWDGIGWLCALSSGATLYLGQNGGVATYSGYQDGGESYLFEWLSPWMPIAQGRNFIPKRALVYLESSSAYSMSLRWSWDYEGRVDNETRTLNVPTPSEWGIFEWGIGEWGRSNTLLVQPYDLSGEGSLFQIGATTVIDGGSLAIQQVDILGKVGRVKR